MAARERTLRLTDPNAMRALAHPLRLRLLRLLREQAPLTGAELAELVGESSAGVSYHLSVLARHGFIERDARPGLTRRHKPWRATFDTITTETEDSSGVILESAEGAFLTAVLTDSRHQQDAYLQRSRELAEVWQDAAVFQHASLLLLPAEVDALSAEVRAVIERLDRDRRDESVTDATAARVSVSFVAVPAVSPREPA